MGRKKILDLKSCKFTLDVSGTNKEILDQLTNNYGIKYGPMINKIIDTFCRMPNNIKKRIEKACLIEYERLTTELQNVEEHSYHYQTLEQEQKYYMEMLNLIHGGTYNINAIKYENQSMKKIKLADGYLIIPSTWIVVNPEKENECRYAAVLECMNYKKYNVPHFIYLNNFKYPRDYSKDMEEDFFSLCEKSWPPFKEIKKLSDENELVEDPENAGQYLNGEAHLAAPIIGLFSIEEHNEFTHREPPFGAMIVRTINNINEE